MSAGAFEARVSGKRESSSGIYLTLLVNPADFNADLATLRVGSTLSMGWVETVNTAVEAIEAVRLDLQIEQAVERNHKDRKPFASLPLSQQSAIRCGDEHFKWFLKDYAPEDVARYSDTADVIRQLCRASSRGQFDVPGYPQGAWVQLEARYQSWLTDQRYAEVRK